MSAVISGHGTTEKIFLGSPAFNPNEVDYSTECAAGAFKLDTTSATARLGTASSAERLIRMSAEL